MLATRTCNCTTWVRPVPQRPLDSYLDPGTDCAPSHVLLFFSPIKQCHLCQVLFLSGNQTFILHCCCPRVASSPWATQLLSRIQLVPRKAQVWQGGIHNTNKAACVSKKFWGQEQVLNLFHIVWKLFISSWDSSLGVWIASAIIWGLREGKSVSTDSDD